MSMPSFRTVVAAVLFAATLGLFAVEAAEAGVVYRQSYTANVTSHPLSTTVLARRRARRGRRARCRYRSCGRRVHRSAWVPAIGTAGASRASWYGKGRATASGERFNPNGLTFAHKTMAFGTQVRFCRDGRCVTARCTDRGPFVAGREFDLSRGAFAVIASLGSGVTGVSWTVV